MLQCNYELCYFFRINNGLDSQMQPFSQDEIIRRATSAVYGHGFERHISRCYNLLTNNCEHFATWTRNGWAISHQVCLSKDQFLQHKAKIL